MEVGLLKMTHDALIGSVLRYAQAFLGVCFPPDLCREIDARVINVAARRILGVDRTARIGTLRFVAGTFSYRHLLVMHLAEQSDLVIRANNSGIQKGAIKALCKAYNTKHLRPEH